MYRNRLVYLRGAMFFFSSFLVFFLLPFSSFGAEEYPAFGRLYGVKETDSIQYSCNKPAGGMLECQFIQTRISKKAKKLSHEELAERAKKEFDDAKNEVLKGETCSYFELFIAAIEGGLDLEVAAQKGGKIGAISDRESFVSGIKELSGEEKERALMGMKAMVSFCKEPTLESHVEILSAANESDAKTCRIGSGSYKQRFKYVEDYNTKKGVWVVVSEPSGSCGVVNLSRFERAASKFGNSDHMYWQYIAKKSITNPKGQLLGLSCDFLDEEEYPYVWKSKEHYLGCEVIDFTGM